MTIEEAQKKRMEIEGKIKEMLVDFELETKMEIDQISLDRMGGTTINSIIFVDVQVKL